MTTDPGLVQQAGVFVLRWIFAAGDPDRCYNIFKDAGRGRGDRID